MLTNGLAGRTERDAVALAVAVFEIDGPVELVECADLSDLDLILDRRGDRPLVVVGGDGSLHTALRALWRRGEAGRCPVGLIPLGTGNDFARGLGIPIDPAEAAKLIVAGGAVPLDLVTDETGDAHGRLRQRPSIAGGTAELPPGASAADGRLDVVVSLAVRPLARLGYALALLRGTHAQRADVLRLTGERMRISGDAFHANADGEITGPHRRHGWTVQPGAWRCFLPPAGRGA